jgi:protein transport protein SEC61 subunit alpha
VSNLYFFSQVLHRKFSGNYFVGFLGKWQEYDMAGHSAPIGVLAYYISFLETCLTFNVTPFMP